MLSDKERFKQKQSKTKMTEAEIRAQIAKTSKPSYLMYHKIRWALVDNDLDKMRF